jgi:hypothetical protein
VQSEEEMARVRDAELDAQKSRVMDELKANKLTSPMGGGGGGGGPGGATGWGEEDGGRKKKQGAKGVLGSMFGRR